MIDNVKFMRNEDILGFMILYKELSYNFYSYLHRKCKGKEARRLSARIASECKSLTIKLKQRYDKLNLSYGAIEKEVISNLYLSILDKPIIPLHKEDWKKVSKKLISYEDLNNLYKKYTDNLLEFLSRLHDKLNILEAKELTNELISRESDYKNDVSISISKVIGNNV